MNNNIIAYNYKLIEEWDDYLSLYGVLEDILPSFVKASNNKKLAKFKISKEKAIRDFKFLNYNSMAVEALIFDIDYKIDNIELYKLIERKMNIKPTWITQTTKGAQIGFVLKSPILYTNKKALKLARKVKKAVTYLLKADVQGSHRLKGLWRNPLKGDFVVTDNLVTLSDFYKLLSTPTQKFNAEIRSKYFIYEQGNRNNYLFLSAMMATKDKEWGKDNNRVYEYLVNLQNKKSLENNVNKLDYGELKSISKSVAKYNLEGQNFVKNFVATKKKVNEGVMNFPKIRGLKIDEYRKEVKKRQKLSAIRTNEKINQNKEKKMTRIENAKKLAKEREERTYKKVVNAITGLFTDEFKKKNGKWNAKKIADELGLDPRTVRKHIKNFTNSTNSTNSTN